jgi:Zn-finger nucleic acid-binding protein
MRTYERSGANVDQCVECRGVFLDRGELERLINAESTFYEPTPAPVPQYRDYDRDRDYTRDRGHGPKRKRGFLSDLFDD